MGQNIEINRADTVGDVLIIDTDRSLTGQDGHVITPDSELEGFPGLLARRLFDLGLGIDHIYVLQNTITLRRPGGWDDETAQRVTETAATFLRHYSDEVVAG